ncbi:hypothetical protein JDV02_004941 [Purpureocillium takamizusanense]|uniref:Protein kinase domain-containing protein n=1 Tax=Purpureocillium takamizusanense TaxID=2060973 RepID=A0A9Q8QG83_9HYPO|nr:uncharacterized protein JDV02_004941 [Purpureocillium takamizusanense]UNI18687.1 hypothetical protein JDV02_004941 [Purpureocillium takamizusanense]
MADPLSVAGLALSVASLTFELFSGCIKGYNLLLDAKDMPKRYRHLLVRLQMEKDKLLGWAVLAKVSESDDSLVTTMKLSRHTIQDAFREMQVLLLDVAKLNQRYSLHLVAVEDESESDEAEAEDAPEPRKLPEHFVTLEQRAVRLFDKTRKSPRRLRWASFDKGKFEELLSTITLLNENMTQFLNAYELEKHFKMQEVTFMQVLQVSNRMDELLELVKSLSAVPVAPEGAMEISNDRAHVQRHAYESRAVRLTRFRALNLSADRTQQGDSIDGKQPPAEALEVSVDDLQVPPVSGSVYPRDGQRSCATVQGKPVWIEWRYYQPVYTDEDDDEIGGPPATLMTRVAKMARLLSDPEKPPEFHVPECLGYVRDPMECRLGFVFKMRMPTEPMLPTSLREHLATLRKPSLTIRLEMARLIAASIWYLHSTEWLHKGLRSDNILFEDTGKGSLSTPVLAGFDYSRPAGLDETTERPTGDPSHELYRHPKTQFDVPREGKNGFRKLYDIYSLGVVLFEIGSWQPIHRVMGLDDGQKPKAAAAKTVRETLLSEEKLNILEGEAGSMFSSAVKFCLTGGSDEERGGRGPDDATLQLEFWEKVLAPLEKIRI